MKYCINCGQALPDEAKFCASCGKAVNDSDNNPSNQRKAVYDGEIHKCPNCGEILNSFELQCSACGYEIRGGTSSSVVEEFANELRRIEKAGGKGLKQRIVTYISTFPIPNTKEELLEFIILSASNISEERYLQDTAKSKQDISDAWLSKFEQAYNKALVAFDEGPELDRIKEIYEKKKAEIQKCRVKGFWSSSNVQLYVLVGLLLLVAVAVVALTR